MTDQPLPPRLGAHVVVKKPKADFAILFGLLALIVSLNVKWGGTHGIATWGLTGLLIAAFVVYFGYSTTGEWRGTFINRRNLVSLPRLQMLSWTALILASVLAGALKNLSLGMPAIGSIAIPESIWMVMGISGVSAAAAPIVDSRVGVRLTARSAPGEARWNDLFMCEEIGQEHVVDVTKLQMFFFTFILILAYGAAIATELKQDGVGFCSLPAVDGGLNALLFFSHAGYLVGKGTPAFSGPAKSPTDAAGADAVAPPKEPKEPKEPKKAKEAKEAKGG